MNTRSEVQKLHRSLEKILHFRGESRNIDFYVSSLTEYNPFYSTDEIVEWLGGMNAVEYFHVERMPLAEMRNWAFDPWTGDLRHSSGGFFSIRGLRVATNAGSVGEWTQPIIHQPEVGVLGIVTRKIDGILYLLMQAKAEPGNINTFQLSPTVQATRSNYLRLHGGKPTLYLEYFLDESRSKVLVDQLQSEQGARFFQKRNRNIIVRVPDDHELELGPNHRWVTLGQLHRLVQRDDTVNMDTRSVISAVSVEPENPLSRDPVDESALRDCLETSPLVGSPLSGQGTKYMVSAHPNSSTRHSMDDVLLRVTREKFRTDLETSLIPLNEVRQWKRSPDEIFHEDHKFFSVVGVRVEAANREVSAWDQPIVRQQDPGIVGLLTREIEGVIHFLAQLKVESGVMDLLEIAPSVQCITGNYDHEDLPPYVSDFVQERGEILVDAHQSEEGGRFYRESNRNMVLKLGEDRPFEEPDRYIWLTLNQLKQLIKFNNFLNVESRSLLSCLELR